MKQFLIMLLLVTGSKVYSQVAVSYYPFQSVLSLSSNTENLIWADLSAETNTFFSNINLEGSTVINIKRTAVINYYAGIGINVNPFYRAEGLAFTNGYALKFGARIKPFKENRNVQFVFELSPYSNRYFDGGLLRTMLGVSYNFNHKK